MTDIAKLVKRLRVLSQWQTGMGTSEPEDHIAWVAADALEAQAQEIEELRAAMRPIAQWSFEAQDGSPAIKELEDDILRVRAALNGEKG